MHRPAGSADSGSRRDTQKTIFWLFPALSLLTWPDPTIDLHSKQQACSWRSTICMYVCVGTFQTWYLVFTNMPTTLKDNSPRCFSELLILIQLIRCTAWEFAHTHRCLLLCIFMEIWPLLALFFAPNERHLQYLETVQPFFVDFQEHFPFY